MKTTRKIFVALLVVFTLLMSMAVVASAAAGQTWTVAGESGLCGSNWSTTDTNNDMTYDADTDSYVKVYLNVKAGSYQFKCAKDHAWGTAYPSSNKTVTVAKDGSTVTITLKGTTVTATVEAPSCDHNYVVTKDTTSCTLAGSKTYECSVCGESYSESIAALGHHYTDGQCDRCDATTTYTTVFVDNAANWTEVYCYTWDVAGYVSWPGEKMTLGEDGLWSYQIPAGNTNVIFNNGASSQTADLKTPTTANNLYNNSTKTWSEGPHVHSYFYPCDPVCQECYEVSNPDATHNVVHVEAVAATCYENGNIEYWYCSYCGTAWTDEAQTQLTNLKSVVLPMAHAEATHVAAVDATCYENGNIEYWYCADCGQAWLDEACTLNTNLKSVVLPVAHTNLVHFDAVAPACHYEGNIEYWVCYDCEGVWQNEALTQLTNIKNVVLPALGGDVVHVEAADAVCHQNGNIEYWYCETCDAIFSDAAGRYLTNYKNLTVPSTAEIIHVAAVGATCTENGNVEYWYCADCNAVFTDAALTQLSNFKNVVVPATGHNFVDGECDCGAEDLTDTDEPTEELNFFQKIWQAIVSFFQFIGKFFGNLFGGNKE